MFITAFFAFIFYINVVVVVGIAAIITVIPRNRFVVDLDKGKLCFVIRKRLKNLEDCDVIRCLASVYQVKI